MDSSIIVAIISGLCVGVPSVIATIMSNNKNNSLTMYRLQKLEEKVEIHNHVVERVYELEKTSTLQDEEIKVANKRIEDLSRKVG